MRWREVGVGVVDFSRFAFYHISIIIILTRCFEGSLYCLPRNISRSKDYVIPPLCLFLFTAVAWLSTPLCVILFAS